MKARRYKVDEYRNPIGNTYRDFDDKEVEFELFMDEILYYRDKEINDAFNAYYGAVCKFIDHTNKYLDALHKYRRNLAVNDDIALDREGTAINGR